LVYTIPNINTSCFSKIFFVSPPVNALLDAGFLFNFINTTEIFYFTTLFNLNFDPVLSEFLIGMRVQSKIPKIFSYIMPQERFQPNT
jgi:hypothetical protein